MSLNGVNSNYQAYETNTVSGSDKKVSTKEISKTTAYSGVAATYEHASQSEGLVAAVNKKASNASIVAQLKANGKHAWLRCKASLLRCSLNRE